MKIIIYFNLLFFLILTSCSSSEYSGTYINHNFNYPSFIVDIPYVEDTLLLEKDLTFYSNYFGIGSYKINENKIILNYEYEMGKASFETTIENVKGEIRIILFKDQNHYYKKTND